MGMVIEIQDLAITVAEYLDLACVISDSNFITMMVVGNGGQLSIIRSFDLLCDFHIVKLKVRKLSVRIDACN